MLETNYILNTTLNKKILNASTFSFFIRLFFKRSVYFNTVNKKNNVSQNMLKKFLFLKIMF